MMAPKQGSDGLFSLDRFNLDLSFGVDEVFLLIYNVISFGLFSSKSIKVSSDLFRPPVNSH